MIRSALANLVCLLAASATLAQTTAPSSQPAETAVPAEAALMELRRPLTELLGELDSADPSRFELARAELMLLDFKEIDKLKAAASQLLLSSAQVASLQEIVSQIFIAGQTPVSGAGWGFMGVNMPPSADNDPRELMPAVILGRVIGCDAYRVLREGDTVVGMQSISRGDTAMTSIGNYREMRGYLRKTKPGEWILVRLIRNGEPVERPLRLGLNNGMRPVNVGPYQSLAEQYWAQQFSPHIRVAPADGTRTGKPAS